MAYEMTFIFHLRFKRKLSQKIPENTLISKSDHVGEEVDRLAVAADEQGRAERVERVEGERLA